MSRDDTETTSGELVTGPWDFAGQTVGDLGNTVVAIARAGDREAARRYLTQYRAFLVGRGNAPETAASNIGYVSGYYDPETARLVRDVFEADHPIFGRDTPTTDEALEAGRQMGRGMREASDV